MNTTHRRSLASTAGLSCLLCLSAASAQCPPVRVVSPEGPDAFRFGGPIATNMVEGGNQWVVGELNQVWAYDYVDGQLVIHQDLRIPHPMTHHLFGQSVAMEGDRLVIGTYHVDWPDRARPSGGAFLYQLIEGEWVYQADLEPPKTLGGSGTGSLVALDGDTIIASGGTPLDVIVYEPRSGAPRTWQAIQVIEGDRDTQFGFPIAARDGWLFVSASRDDAHTFAGGSVFVYRRQSNGTYQRVQKIDGPPIASYRIQLFGSTLDFDGQTLAIGAGVASPEIEGQGAVYTFELDSGFWTHTQTLTHSGAEPDDYFAYRGLLVDGDRMLVHADGDRTPRGDAALYAFERTAVGVWRQSARPMPKPPYRARYYGGMALVNGLAMVGAAGETEGPLTPETGAAYLFDLSCYECPDLDADDHLTVFDYLEFMRAFDAGEAIADMDNDGALTVADFLVFLDAFAVGCP